MENDDPHEHISNITRIIDLFHSPEVSRDQVILMAFPFTLKGKSKQWMKRLSSGLIKTWDLFRSAFLNEYRPPLRIIKQIEIIRNFKQEPNEPLHCSWERFMESLFGCPEHKEGNFVAKNKELQAVLSHISSFEDNMNIITEKVRMVQHKYEIPMEGRISKLEETLDRRKAKTWNKEVPDKRNTLQSHSPPIPFPSRLKKEKEKEQYKIFFENLQQLSINIPFMEVLEQMPKYAKFMKYLLSKKEKVDEASKITLNERCFAVLLNKIPLKEKDPGSFTISCTIGKFRIDKALADLGANISLMPYSMYSRLDLGKLKPTWMYMKEDHKIPIILGRPFLATTHTMIDVFNKKISFEITFDIEKSIKFSIPEDDTYSLLFEPILNYQQGKVDDLWVDENDDTEQSLNELNENDWESEDLIKPTLFATNTREAETQTPKLKELPSHLEYAFLDDNQELPVIISSLLSHQEKKLLLYVLSKHKETLAWKVVDIKGISPSFCTHKILMEDDFNAVVQPQRRLNPKV
ncbi:putative nucleotidyltransferase, ribonuclease H [Tanacetum coccineum]